MIKIKLGIILFITDAFTGETVDGRGLQFIVDGAERAAIHKPGGFYVFANVPEGQHTVVIRSLQYEEMTIQLANSEDIVPVSLKPGKAYGFGRFLPQHLCVTVESDRKAFWFAQNKDLCVMKLAQPEVKAGETEANLFFEDMALKIPLPAYFLIVDGVQSEIVRVDMLAKGEPALFAEGLHFAHKRGCRMYPAVFYHVGQKREAIVFAKSLKESYIFTEEGKEPAVISDGQQVFEIE